MCYSGDNAKHGQTCILLHVGPESHINIPLCEDHVQLMSLVAPARRSPARDKDHDNPMILYGIDNALVFTKPALPHGQRQPNARRLEHRQVDKCCSIRTKPS
jgi:hypothetical protein